MVGALGVNQALLFTGTLFLGAALVQASRGALQTPQLAGQPAPGHLRHRRGLRRHGGRRHGDSVTGAFLAALPSASCRPRHPGLPKVTLVLVFLLMALVLVVRPWGLLAGPRAARQRAVLPEGMCSLCAFRPAPTCRRGQLVGSPAAAVRRRRLPRQGRHRGPVLRARRLQLEFSDWRRRHCQLRSRRLLRHLRPVRDRSPHAWLPMEARPVQRARSPRPRRRPACLRRAPDSGIYLAMLTLAFAQITHAVAFQWVEVTGGDNGVVGGRPAAGRRSHESLYLTPAAGRAPPLGRASGAASTRLRLRAAARARDLLMRADDGINVKTTAGSPSPVLAPRADWRRPVRSPRVRSIQP